MKNGNERLMGFGHRVYKNYDPRAKIIKKACDDVFEVTGVNPLLEIAMELEKIALEDEYFVTRKLYPNVDFYSGLIYEAFQFPPEMFTVLFAIGRTPGWLAQWLELVQDKEQKIARPQADLHRRPHPRLRARRRALGLSADRYPDEGRAPDGSELARDVTHRPRPSVEPVETTGAEAEGTVTGSRPAAMPARPDRRSSLSRPRVPRQKAPSPGLDPRPCPLDLTVGRACRDHGCRGRRHRHRVLDPRPCPLELGRPPAQPAGVTASSTSSSDWECRSASKAARPPRKPNSRLVHKM